MFDPANVLVPPPPSSTADSSVSSSDLDTESTGSFFHDRSTSLGTLMGVNFPAIAFRIPSQRQEANVSAVGNDVHGRGGRRKGKKAPPLVSVAERRRRKWWSLCRDDDESRPSSLGEFLEVERRFGDVALFGASAELEGGFGGAQTQHEGLLFANGRVIPPLQVDEVPHSTSGALCRFPVSLTGICSGGAG